MTDPTTVEKPTGKGEWTIIGIAAGSWVIAVYVFHVLATGQWQPSSDADRIKWLGTGAIGALMVMALVALIFLSRWVGSIRVTGPGVSLEAGEEREAEHG